MEITRSYPVLGVHDLDLSGVWYRDVLGCELDDVAPGDWRFCRAAAVIFMLGRCPDVSPASELGPTDQIRLAAGHPVTRNVIAVLRIRDAAVTETAVLEDLQRRSSNIWETYREQLAANPDAIEMPQTFLDNGWAVSRSTTEGCRSASQS